MNERDSAKTKLEAIEKQIRSYIEELHLTNVYSYTKIEEAIERLRDKEIESMYPALDIDAALDDLIIESVDEDFNVDDFINRYLKKVSNE